MDRIEFQNLPSTDHLTNYVKTSATCCVATRVAGRSCRDDHKVMENAIVADGGYINTCIIKALVRK
jgi:hypothetical protein